MNNKLKVTKLTIQGMDFEITQSATNVTAENLITGEFKLCYIGNGFQFTKERVLRRMVWLTFGLLTYKEN